MLRCIIKITTKITTKITIKITTKITPKNNDKSVDKNNGKNAFSLSPGDACDHGCQDLLAVRVRNDEIPTKITEYPAEYTPNISNYHDDALGVAVVSYLVD